jgi:hypothetical protein
MRSGTLQDPSIRTVLSGLTVMMAWRTREGRDGWPIALAQRLSDARARF